MPFVSTFLTLSSLFAGRELQVTTAVDALARCKLASLETQALRLQDSMVPPCTDAAAAGDAVTSTDEEELCWMEILLLQVDDTPFLSGSIMPSSFSCCCRISS